MNYIREEQLLGNRKVIVGTKYNDLVLETLGKVYVKSGNTFKQLSELLSKQKEQTKENVIVVDSVSQMQDMQYPEEGTFVYVKNSQSLYLACDGKYVLLIHVDVEGDTYVKTTGDTMTGVLEINTTVAPLIVTSRQLVKNLNADLIDGYDSKDLAKKDENENISGQWTFTNTGTSQREWTFEDNIRVKGDFISSGDLTSPSFASGFSGYGWRLDSSTNTLTIDNLIVRKILSVYELVVNQISATNGSLWISNAGTCESVEQPLILPITYFNWIEDGGWQGTESQKTKFKQLIGEGVYYLITQDTLTDMSINGESMVSESESLSSPQQINTIPKTFVNYNYIFKITDIDGLLENSSFQGSSTLLNDTTLLSTFSNYVRVFYLYKKKTVSGSYVSTFSKDSGFYAHIEDRLIKIKPYYKYFALEKQRMQNQITACLDRFSAEQIQTSNYPVPDLWIITTDTDKYPYFKPGDFIRCQKFQDNTVKYYDAIVLSQMEGTSYIVQKAPSVLDIYTEISYSQNGTPSYTQQYNNTAYNNSEKGYNYDTGEDVYLEGYESEEDRLEKRLADPAEKDDLVQIGNIYDTNRQNAIYLTSSDDQSPYIDVISNVNRPDYSVLYEIPVYKRYSYINTTDIDNGYIGIRYNYYLLEPVEGNSGRGIPIYNNDNTLIYYGTTSPEADSIIEQVDGQNQYEFTSTTKVRIGKLDGIYNATFGDKQPYGYGLYGENVFLTGEFYLNNGQSVADFNPEGIILRYKNAGLELIDNPDGDGEVINLYADKFKVTLNSGQTLSFFKDDSLDNALFNVEGWIKANSLNINDKCIINSDGTLRAENAYLSGTIVASSGTIGGFKITSSSIGTDLGEEGEDLSKYNGMGLFNEFIKFQNWELNRYRLCAFGVNTAPPSLGTVILNRIEYDTEYENDNAIGAYIYMNRPQNYQGLSHLFAIKASGACMFEQKKYDIWNTPGVLWAAEVIGMGELSIPNKWGNGLGDNNITIKRTSTGVYQITHNLGTGDWMPFVQCFRADKWVHATIVSRDENSFTFSTHENGGDGLLDSNFFVMIVGRNKTRNDDGNFIY